MEHNRVLMIIVSVGVFFAAVVGVGLALLYPRAEDASAIAGTSAVREFDPIEYVRQPDPAPLTPEAAPDEPVVIILGEEEATDGVIPPGADGVAVQTITDEPVPLTERPAREPRPAVGQRPEAPKSGTSTVTPAPVAARRAEPVTPPTRRERVTEYWIQLIASESLDRVEQARGTLGEYSLGGRITTREVDGDVFYRLRVGPYGDADEADKFLEWIRDIDGFESAWISQEYPLRTIES